MNIVGSLAYGAAQGAANLVYRTATLPAQVLFGERKDGDVLVQVRSWTAPYPALPCLVCYHMQRPGSTQGAIGGAARGDMFIT